MLPSIDWYWEGKSGTGRFQRGIGSYPGLDDSVHFATADDLRSVFPPANDKYIKLGNLTAAE